MMNPGTMCITATELETYRTTGYLVVRSLISPDDIRALIDEVDRWTDASRDHPESFGELQNGKPRFEVESGHSRTVPRLRRIANPCDLSAAYRDVLWNGPLLDRVEALIGANIRFHHCKLNIKLPRGGTRIGYHQDQGFDPHTNDDVVTSVLLLDASTDASGCLCVVPGSHRERYSLYRGERFVGEVTPEAARAFEARAVPITGEAGDAVFIDSWLMHGSGPNRSDLPRTLLIAEYSAADAVPLFAPHVPSEHTGRLLRGDMPRTVRLTAGVRELPQAYAASSIFALQASADEPVGA